MKFIVILLAIVFVFGFLKFFGDKLIDKIEYKIEKNDSNK